MTTLAGWPAAAPLQSADLLLEPLRVDHAEEMAPVLDDPRLHTYIGGRPATLEQLRERYRRQVVGRSDDGAQRWFNWVLRHRTSGCAVGYVQATVGACDGMAVAEVAWVVASEYQGRGLAGQAAEAMVRWLRESGSDRVVAHVHPDHRASTAVAARVVLRPTATAVDGEVEWTG